MRKLWNAFLVFIGGVSCMGHAEEQQLSKARVVAPFVFYCEDKDVGVIDEVLEPLQDVLKRTVENYHCALPETIDVKIFPTLPSLHEYLKKPEAEDWLIGGCTRSNEISFVSPNEQNSWHSRVRILFLPLHSLIQLQLDTKYPTAPAWIKKGLSQCESGVFDSTQMREKVRKFFRQKIENAQIPTWSDLQSYASMFHSQAETFPYTMIHFIQQKWGQEVLISLLEKEGDTEKVLGVSKDFFYNQWLVFLKDRVKNS
jgi:hypothetical protein